MKICHVVCSLEAGGIERWLLSVCQAAKQADLDWDLHILVLFNGEMTLMREFEGIGVQVAALNFRWLNYFATVRKLKKFFSEQKFDVVHSHLDYLSGVVLPAADKCKVPVRLNHVHNTHFGFATAASRTKRLLGAWLKARARKFSTTEMACSKLALDAFFGPHSHALVHHCSIPLPASTPTKWDRWKAREELGLLQSKTVLLSLGRLSPQKNPKFTLRVFEEFLKWDSNGVLLFAGDGPEREELENLAQALTVEDAVVFLGVRDDVSRLLCASDLLIQPSLYEGLPVSVLEAQAYGVHSVISDNITSETIVVSGLVTQMSLSASLSSWARTMSDCIRKKSKQTQVSSNAIQNSSFNIFYGLNDLERIYRL